jgi:hypothetical protein
MVCRFCGLVVDSFAHTSEAECVAALEAEVRRLKRILSAGRTADQKTQSRDPDGLSSNDGLGPPSDDLDELR